MKLTSIGDQVGAPDVSAFDHWWTGTGPDRESGGALCREGMMTAGIDLAAEAVGMVEQDVIAQPMGQPQAVPAFTASVQRNRTARYPPRPLPNICARTENWQHQIDGGPATVVRMLREHDEQTATAAA